MKTNKYLLLLLAIILFSCSENDDIPIEQTDQQTNSQSGVVITFDDDYVDQWYEVDKILKPYDWKATFFISKFDQLTAEQIQKLKDFKKEGYEIGAHGLNHLNAPKYIYENGTDEYVNREITPMLTLMDKNDLSPTSFAYPYGARDSATDNTLLNKFQIIRGTTYDDLSPEKYKYYYNNNRLVFGLGLDQNYSHYTNYYLSLLEYAKNNNKIVVFYAHKPVMNVQNDYETEYKRLIDICEYVHKNKMKFYKISELYNLAN
ncbi:polysaccharide deacetylase family protein [Flavobacterium sp. WC2509]|uniref:polysaccharide deacetylase family protein n=1 Tax=Flavobacterium sp. WC2509 TaxID=3461406 RepID=UPI004043D36D